MVSKVLVLGVISVAAFLGSTQQPPHVHGSEAGVQIFAQKEMKGAGPLQLRGEIEITTNRLKITADEADYFPLANTLDLRGHVHVMLTGDHHTLKLRDSSPEDVPAR